MYDNNDNYIVIIDMTIMHITTALINRFENVRRLQLLGHMTSCRWLGMSLEIIMNDTEANCPPSIKMVPYATSHILASCMTVHLDMDRYSDNKLESISDHFRAITEDTEFSFFHAKE